MFPHRGGTAWAGLQSMNGRRSAEGTEEYSQERHGQTGVQAGEHGGPCGLGVRKHLRQGEGGRAFQAGGAQREQTQGGRKPESCQKRKRLG